MTKEGRVKTTLIVRDAKDLAGSLLDFDGDVTIIGLTPDVGSTLNGVVKALDGLRLYKIVPKPDPNLQGIGVNLDYHAVDPIEVTDALFTDPDYLIFNGEVKIPRKLSENIPVVGGYYTDFEQAQELCTELNAYTSRRVDEIMHKLAQSKKFMQKIADNGMV